MPISRYKQLQERIANIVQEYHTYVNDANVMEYLRKLGYNLNL